jgi:hypothetical protein
LIVIAISAFITIRVAEARRWVVGPADPKTGTRICYSVSPLYAKQPMLDDQPIGGKDLAEGFIYTYRTPPHFIKWLTDHGLYKSGHQGHYNGITFAASDQPMMSDWAVDKNEFVDINNRADDVRLFSVVSQEKRLVDGCPTTLIVENLDLITADGRPAQAICLVLYPKGGSMSYLFETYGTEGETDNADVQELKAIRDSVEIISREWEVRRYGVGRR